MNGQYGVKSKNEASLSDFPSELLAHILQDITFMVIPLWKCGNRILNIKLADGVTKIELRDVKWTSQSRWPKLLLSLPKLTNLSIDRGSGALMPSAAHLSEQLQQLPRRMKRLVLKSLEAPKAMLHHTHESSESSPIYRKRYVGIGESRLIEFPCMEDLEVRGRGEIEAIDWSGLPSSLTRFSISQYELGSIDGLRRLPRGLLELEAVLWGGGGGGGGQGNQQGGGRQGNQQGGGRQGIGLGIGLGLGVGFPPLLFGNGGAALNPLPPFGPNNAGNIAGNVAVNGAMAAFAPIEIIKKAKIEEDLSHLPPSLTSLSHLSSSPLSSTELWKLIPRSVTRIGGDSTATHKIHWTASLLLPPPFHFPHSLSHLHIIYIDASSFESIGTSWAQSLPRHLKELHVGEERFPAFPHRGQLALFLSPPLLTPDSIKSLPPSLTMLRFDSMVDWSLFLPKEGDNRCDNNLQRTFDDGVSAFHDHPNPSSDPPNPSSDPPNPTSDPPNPTSDHLTDLNYLTPNHNIIHYHHLPFFGPRGMTRLSLESSLPSSLHLSFFPDTLVSLKVTIDITARPFESSSLNRFERMKELELGFLLSSLPFLLDSGPPSLDDCSLTGLPQSLTHLRLFSPSLYTMVFSPGGSFISSLPPFLSSLHVEHTWNTIPPYASTKDAFEALKWPPTLKSLHFQNWISSWPFSFLPSSATSLRIETLHYCSYHDMPEALTTSDVINVSKKGDIHLPSPNPSNLGLGLDPSNLNPSNLNPSNLNPSNLNPSNLNPSNLVSPLLSPLPSPALPMLRELAVSNVGAILEHDHSGYRQGIEQVRTQDGNFLSHLPSLLSLSLPSAIPFRSSAIRHLSKKLEYLDIRLVEVEESDIERLPSSLKVFSPGPSFPLTSPSLVSILPLDAFIIPSNNTSPPTLVSATTCARERSHMYPDPRSLIRLPSLSSLPK